MQSYFIVIENARWQMTLVVQPHLKHAEMHVGQGLALKKGGSRAAWPDHARIRRPERHAPEEWMKTGTQKTIRLGDLVVALFDEAARHSSDPDEVSRVATRAVLYVLRCARRTLTPLSPRAASIESSHGQIETPAY